MEDGWELGCIEGFIAFGWIEGCFDGPRAGPRVGLLEG